MDSLFVAIRNLLRIRTKEKYREKRTIAFLPESPSSSKLIIRVKSDSPIKSYRVPESYAQILESCIIRSAKASYSSDADKKLVVRTAVKRLSLSRKPIFTISSSPTRLRKGSPNYRLATKHE